MFGYDINICNKDIIYQCTIFLLSFFVLNFIHIPYYMNLILLYKSVIVSIFGFCSLRTFISYSKNKSLKLTILYILAFASF